MVKISRKKVAKNPCEYWNAFNVVLAMSDIKYLSGVMRECHLVYWYASEVWNGGHRLYYDNRKDFDHAEVLAALKNLGAAEHAGIFEESMKFAEALKNQDNEERNSQNIENILLDLDTRLYHTQPEIFDFLENVQKQHEAVLVKWVE